MPAIIESSDLVKYYKNSDRPAVDGLNLNVAEGSLFTLLGRNGAGKTTFLRIATTQLLQTSGSVSVFGLDTVKEARQIRRRIAVAPQEAKPLWSLNPYDHVVLTLMMRGGSYSASAAKAGSVLDKLDLREFRKVHSEDLSGGLRQRILIAMTIACDVEILFLDEPTIGLDPIGRRRVWNELIRLKREQGKTIVLTTHYMDEAEALSDELVIVEKGKALVKGTPSDVRGSHLKSRLRVDVSSGFSHDELETFGMVTTAGNITRVFVDEEAAQELGREAVKRKAAISISPVTLDDVFVDVVGSRIEEGEEAGRHE
jgi:ABC-2 type transport system ATP-binding protein